MLSNGEFTEEVFIQLACALHFTSLECLVLVIGSIL